jgi:rhamnopyranosyl-N-acetylglucosaminyl-diphospho-decaprenol beta-1,3/1,4-galactofuranosyltransferase
MRVMAYVHTFNDADVIDGALHAILHQTRPPDDILLVDNASTDGTLDRIFPQQVNVIRNTTNLGSCGAIGIGLSHALEHGFDWMWLLDADSAPEPEALARLLDLYNGWPTTLQEETGVIACLPYDQSIGQQLHGLLFTTHGRVVVTPEPEQRYYICHMTRVWSGSLYRLAAVRRVGLPNPDYFIDRGELEYMYRVMKAGYKAFIHRDAVIRHNVGGTSVGPSKRLKVGPISVTLYEAAPLRCYYTVRNTLYFTLYDSTDGPLAKFRELFRLRSRPGRSLMSGIAWQAGFFTLNFALRPLTHGAQVVACMRGAWDGLTGNIAARY